jgi:nucleotide-binding universal stress UspA family protein
MSSKNERAIILAVGPEGRLSDGTVAFAVEASRRLDVAIELVHVVPIPVGWATGTFGVQVSIDQFLSEGEHALATAMEDFRACTEGTVRVTGVVLRGSVAGTLVERSRHASLVVLQPTHHGRVDRVVSGSVTESVAARAHAPVVAVPPGWSPSADRLPVTVGVEDGERAEALLWSALGIAAAEDLPVRVVRATYLPEAYQEILRRETREKDFLRTARADLVRDCDLDEDVRGQVPVTFDAVWGTPAEVLVELSERSSLVVVGRRDPRLPIGSHLGPVVRGVLRHAACPVMVVEPRLAEHVVPEHAGLAGHAGHEQAVPTTAG